MHARRLCASIPHLVTNPGHHQNTSHATAVDPERELLQAYAEAFARILDSAIRILGTNLSIGPDPLIGLIPGIGDALMGLVSTVADWAFALGVLLGTLSILTAVILAILWLVMKLRRLVQSSSAF